MSLGAILAGMEPLIAIWLLGMWALLVWATTVTAAAKNRSTGWFFLLGVLFGLIALVVVAVIPALPRPPRRDGSVVQHEQRREGQRPMLRRRKTET